MYISHRILRLAVLTTVLGTLLVFSAAVVGQKSTELFVPIGESPGLSGVHTLIGRVQAVNPAARTLTVAAAAGARSVRLDDKTLVFIDRSKLRQLSTIGTLADFRPEQNAEVKFRNNNAAAGIAEWVKVQPAS